MVNESPKTPRCVPNQGYSLTPKAPKKKMAWVNRIPYKAQFNNLNRLYAALGRKCDALRDGVMTYSNRIQQLEDQLQSTGIKIHHTVSYFCIQFKT